MLRRAIDLFKIPLRAAALPLVTVSIGLVAFTAAATLRLTDAQGTAATVAELCFWIAQTTIGAGIVVGVMRALRSADYFKDGVREVIYNDELPVGSIDFDQTWRNLTAALVRRRFPSIKPEEIDLTHKALMGDVGYHYVRHKRTLKIRWRDRAKSLIEIEDRVDATLRVADVDSPVYFVAWFDRDVASTQLPQFSIKLKIGSENPREFGLGDMKPDGTRLTLTESLPRDSVAVIDRCGTKDQSLLKDPFLNYVSTCMMQNMSIDVSCESGIGFYFRKAGLAGEFVRTGAKDADMNGVMTSLAAEYTGLGLKNQGYMLIIVAISGVI